MHVVDQSYRYSTVISWSGEEGRTRGSDINLSKGGCEKLAVETRGWRHLLLKTFIVEVGLGCCIQPCMHGLWFAI